MIINFIKPKRKVDRVYLHCSASPRPEHGDVSVIREWHKARGWNDIGYHYFIPFDGELQKGRSLEKSPAAQKGNNTKTIAICLHGLHKPNFTLNQFDTLQKLCKQIDIKYLGDVTFHGHCEVSLKTCPVFDYKAVLDLDSIGRLVKTSKPKYFDMFDTGIEIMNIQKQLNVFLEAHKLEIIVDGIFGQETTQSVLFFQKVNNMISDGIVGPETQLMLPALKG